MNPPPSTENLENSKYHEYRKPQNREFRAGPPSTSSTRKQCLLAIQKYNLKQMDIAKETGIHHSTLSLWLQEKVKGHKVHIQESIQHYLDNFLWNKPSINGTHIRKWQMLKGGGGKNGEDLLNDIYLSEDNKYIQRNMGTQINNNINNTPETWGRGHVPTPLRDSMPLITMRINIELDGRVLDELFLWDNNEPYLFINMFAQILVEEHNLPISF